MNRLTHPPPQAQVLPPHIKICPLLLRVFIKENQFHSPSEFKSRTNVPEQDEIQLYVWRYSTLKDISELIQEVHIPARSKDTKMKFAYIYQDERGNFSISPPLGVVDSLKRSDDDFKSLESLDYSYQFLAVSFENPNSNKKEEMIIEKEFEIKETKESENVKDETEKQIDSNSNNNNNSEVEPMTS